VREKFVLVVRLEELDVSNVDPLIVVGIKLAPADASRLHTQLLFHRITKQLYVNFMPVRPSSGTQSEIFQSIRCLTMDCNHYAPTFFFLRSIFSVKEILWHH
jgi:hypothetical protein